MRPFGEKRTAPISLPKFFSGLCASVCLISTVRMSQRLMVASEFIYAMRLPSGEKATEITPNFPPLSVRFILPDLASHIRTVPSKTAAANVFPSGVKLIDSTLSCGLYAWFGCACAVIAPGFVQLCPAVALGETSGELSDLRVGL